MTRKEPEATADEPHVFDQTNGVVDLGADEPEQPSAADGWSDSDRKRVVGGIAMMSVKKP